MARVKRQSRRVVIGLGANLGARRQTLESAIRVLTSELGTLLELSRWHETEPLVPEGEDPAAVPKFLNGAAMFETRMSPVEVLTVLRILERELGRDRARERARWQPRIVDLDLIAYEDEVIMLPDLIVPHPHMHKRRFVLEPLCEIWPDWRHPQLGLTARELLNLCD